VGERIRGVLVAICEGPGDSSKFLCIPRAEGGKSRGGKSSIVVVVLAVCW